MSWWLLAFSVLLLVLQSEAQFTRSVCQQQADCIRCVSSFNPFGQRCMWQRDALGKYHCQDTCIPGNSDCSNVQCVNVVAAAPAGWKGCKGHKDCNTCLGYNNPYGQRCTWLMDAKGQTSCADGCAVGARCTNTQCSPNLAAVTAVAQGCPVQITCTSCLNTIGQYGQRCSWQTNSAGQSFCNDVCAPGNRCQTNGCPVSRCQAQSSCSSCLSTLNPYNQRCYWNIAHSGTQTCNDNCVAGVQSCDNRICPAVTVSLHSNAHCSAQLNCQGCLNAVNSYGQKCFWQTAASGHQHCHTSCQAGFRVCSNQQCPGGAGSATASSAAALTAVTGCAGQVTCMACLSHKNSAGQFCSWSTSACSDSCPAGSSSRTCSNTQCPAEQTTSLCSSQTTCSSCLLTANIHGSKCFWQTQGNGAANCLDQCSSSGQTSCSNIACPAVSTTSHCQQQSSCATCIASVSTKSSQRCFWQILPSGAASCQDACTAGTALTGGGGCYNNQCPHTTAAVTSTHCEAQTSCAACVKALNRQQQVCTWLRNATSGVQKCSETTPPPTAGWTTASRAAAQCPTAGATASHCQKQLTCGACLQTLTTAGQRCYWQQSSTGKFHCEEACLAGATALCSNQKCPVSSTPVRSVNACRAYHDCNACLQGTAAAGAKCTWQTSNTGMQTCDDTCVAGSVQCSNTQCPAGSLAGCRRYSTCGACVSTTSPFGNPCYWVHQGGGVYSCADTCTVAGSCTNNVCPASSNGCDTASSCNACLRLAGPTGQRCSWQTSNLGFQSCTATCMPGTECSNSVCPGNTAGGDLLLQNDYCVLQNECAACVNTLSAVGTTATSLNSKRCYWQTDQNNQGFCASYCYAGHKTCNNTQQAICTANKGANLTDACPRQGSCNDCLGTLNLGGSKCAWQTNSTGQSFCASACLPGNPTCLNSTCPAVTVFKSYDKFSPCQGRFDCGTCLSTVNTLGARCTWQTSNTGVQTCGESCFVNSTVCSNYQCLTGVVAGCARFSTCGACTVNLSPYGAPCMWQKDAAGKSVCADTCLPGSTVCHNDQCATEAGCGAHTNCTACLGAKCQWTVSNTGLQTCEKTCPAGSQCVDKACPATGCSKQTTCASCLQASAKSGSKCSWQISNLGFQTCVDLCTPGTACSNSQCPGITGSSKATVVHATATGCPAQVSCSTCLAMTNAAGQRCFWQSLANGNYICQDTCKAGNTGCSNTQCLISPVVVASTCLTKTSCSACLSTLNRNNQRCTWQTSNTGVQTCGDVCVTGSTGCNNTVCAANATKAGCDRFSSCGSCLSSVSGFGHKCIWQETKDKKFKCGDKCEVGAVNCTNSGTCSSTLTAAATSAAAVQHAPGSCALYGRCSDCVNAVSFAGPKCTWSTDFTGRQACHDTCPAGSFSCSNSQCANTANFQQQTYSSAAATTTNAAVTPVSNTQYFQAQQPRYSTASACGVHSTCATCLSAVNGYGQRCTWQQDTSGRSSCADYCSAGLLFCSSSQCPAAAAHGQVQVESKTRGVGRFPRSGDTLSVHYVGVLRSNGMKFDSSYDRGSPYTFVLGQNRVIQGWEEGFKRVSLGEHARIHVPAAYGYGARGAGLVPPNADLIFDVHLVVLNGQPANLYG
mmetsp:Transcript_42810/g.83911  ORF Transcript_42810/g.83911 Transcript_42810/m.83911 type:complete len:1613 (+) Transcript_42810:52-4890(+)|eukprot:CAMPEP_0175128318 /NCGR_PEP_ID=MMETSP0087-20121206/4865_1 /TAXON_ID=136419 /ORGANISM="Unknown Unknown, Strain D1" /LENGTH=1612 /DNA_ID=CAMNT_0016410373 /DNA_START=52 /DNA_END=4890 /DNA_ORIENTATION=-